MCKLLWLQLNICALSTNSHYILLVVQKFYWMSQTYFLFTIYDNIYITQWNNISSNWNIWIPIFLLYLHKSPEVRTPLSYCTLMYTLCTSWSCILDMSCIPVLYPLYYTICAWFSSKFGFGMIKWRWSCLKSISQNEWVAQPLKIAYDSEGVCCLGYLALFLAF